MERSAGGNHFIELQSDGQFVWIIVHSGSRNFGLTKAVYHIKKAKEITEKYGIKVPKDLDYFPEHCAEGQHYLEDLEIAGRFAHNNRQVMIQTVKDALERFLPGVQQLELVNIHHNYVAKENHFGRNVLVHRKGATLARSNTVGIIPGSMGTSSYIVQGKQNEDSFHSCSHGAGRTMSRTKAKATLGMDKFKEQMSSVYSQSINESHLDEAPDSYKDINEVMENQRDLVDIRVELKPILNIKG